MTARGSRGKAVIEYAQKLAASPRSEVVLDVVSELYDGSNASAEANRVATKWRMAFRRIPSGDEVLAGQKIKVEYRKAGDDYVVFAYLPGGAADSMSYVDFG